MNGFMIKKLSVLPEGYPDSDLFLPSAGDCAIMAETPSFPRKRESRSLKLLSSPTDWMPASAGMTIYDAVSRAREEGPLRFSGRNR